MAEPLPVSPFLCGAETMLRRMVPEKPASGRPNPKTFSIFAIDGDMKVFSQPILRIAPLNRKVDVVRV